MALEIKNNSNFLPTIEIGKEAPDFSGDAYHSGNFIYITNKDYLGKYVVLFFYPLDFTFVCPTELLVFNELAPTFAQNNCSIIGCSVDSKYSHMKWSQTNPKQGGVGELSYPLLSDITKNVARRFGALCTYGCNEGLAYRATVIIDTKGRVRHLTYSDLAVGRNVEETLRLVQALQYSDENGEVCPSRWKRKGDKTMVADHTQEKTKEYFEKTSA